MYLTLAHDVIPAFAVWIILIGLLVAGLVRGILVWLTALKVFSLAWKAARVGIRIARASAGPDDSESSAGAPRTTPETQAPEVGKEQFVAALKQLAKRIALFAVTGILVGTAAFAVLWLAGLLQLGWPPWTYLVWVLLPVYVAAAFLLSALMGFWLGASDAALAVGLDSGLLSYWLNRVMDQAAAFLGDVAESEEVSPNVLVGCVHKAVRKLLAAAEHPVGNFFKNVCCKIVELYLIVKIKDERRHSKRGRFSFTALRKLVDEKVSERLVAFLRGWSKGMARKMALLMALAFVFPPFALWIIETYVLN